MYNNRAICIFKTTTEKLFPPSAEREKIEREITITDEKIEEIVYGLYDISDDEQKIVKGH